MKKLIYIFWLVFLAVNAHAQVPPYIPTNGLVAWYPFNGNANDESGNGLNGTVNGATLTSDRFGNANSAYSFTPTSETIDLFTSNTWCSGDHSISFWFNTQYINGKDQYILTKRSSCLGGSEIYFEARVEPTGNSIQMGWGGGSAGYFYNISFTPNVWNNIVYVVSGASESLYLNGVSVGNQSHNNPTNSVMLRIGDHSCSYPDDDYNGKFDDLGLWNRALTQQEVTQLFNGTTCNSADITTGLVASYPFNGNANDISGNGNNGIVNGATLTTDRFGNANNAYSFSSGNYIEVPDDSVLRLNNTDFTISSWVLLNDTLPQLVNYGSYCILSKRGLSPADGYMWGITANNFTVPIAAGEVAYQVSGGGDPRAFSTSKVTLSKWQHILMTYSNSTQTIQIYINGSLNSTATGIPTPNPNTLANLWIGNDVSGSPYYFHGSLDDIGIWNRALTQCDIDSLYHITSEISAGVSNIINGDLKMQIFPNPSSNQFNVQIVAQKNEKARLVITDMIGRKLSEEMIEINAGINNKKISVTSSGTYFISLITSTGEQTRKVVVIE